MGGWGEVFFYPILFSHMYQDYQFFSYLILFSSLLHFLLSFFVNFISSFFPSFSYFFLFPVSVIFFSLSLPFPCYPLPSLPHYHASLFFLSLFPLPPILSLDSFLSLSLYSSSSSSSSSSLYSLYLLPNIPFIIVM